MFAYAATFALGGEPGTRDAAAKAVEVQIRKDGNNRPVESQHPTLNAISLKTWPGGPEMLLLPAVTGNNFISAINSLTSWATFRNVDVVVFNVLVHFVCEPPTSGMPSTAYTAFLDDVLSAWAAGVKRAEHEPLLVWRSAGAVHPQVGGNPCPPRLFPILPEFAEAGTALMHRRGVRVLDQWAHSRTRFDPDAASDGLHLFATTLTQVESASKYTTQPPPSLLHC